MAVVTMRDIARRAEVSQATVSLVLNNRSSALISETTRSRVHQAAREMGYRPNQNARALARGKTDTIGLWVRALHSTYYMQFLHELDALVTGDGYSLIISRSTAFHETTSIMQAFPMQSVDGIIALDVPEAVALLTQNPSAPTPLVNLCSRSGGAVDYVTAELETGTAEALEYLIAQGRQSIALLIDEPSHRNADARETIYLDKMREAGREPDTVVAPGQHYADAMDAVLERLKTGRPLDALFCYNDDMAIGANRALHQAGLRVPGDVAVIGCDDIEQARYMEPPLSSIGHSRRELCRLTWQFLQNRMRDPQIPQQEAVIHGHFIRRGSS